MNRNADLREKILEVSIELYKSHGVKAATIKQIAHAAGCTNAALYYYFPGGKSEILEEALHGVLAKRIETFEQLNTGVSFHNFLTQMGTLASRDFGSVADNMSWLLVEFPNLPDELKAELHEHLKEGHGVLSDAFARYLDDRDEAARTAWMLFCTFIGYQQVFGKLGLASIVEFSSEDLVASVIRAIESAHQQARSNK